MKDYYQYIWNDNILVAIYTAVYFIIFMATLIAMFHLLIARPIGSLRQQLVFPADAIRNQSIQIPTVQYWE